MTNNTNEPEVASKYLKIVCPVKSCKQELILSCPTCHKGVLSCQNPGGGLSCCSCKSSLQGMKCRCGYTIGASYVKEKEKQLKYYQDNVNPETYKAIAYVFGAMFIVMCIITVL
jgi:hypothetical protein